MVIHQILLGVEQTTCSASQRFADGEEPPTEREKKLKKIRKIPTDDETYWVEKNHLQVNDSNKEQPPITLSAAVNVPNGWEKNKTKHDDNELHILVQRER